MRTWGIVLIVIGVLVLYLGVTGKASAAWLALTGWTPPTTPEPKTDTGSTKVPSDTDMRGGTTA